MTSTATPPFQRPMDRALFVDDHPLFCDALSMILWLVAGVQVVEAAGSLAKATARLDTYCAAFEAVRAGKRFCPRVPRPMPA